MSTTTTADSSSGVATRSAAATAVPPDPPMRIPSRRVTARAVSKASASLTAMTSSTRLGS